LAWGVSAWGAGFNPLPDTGQHKCYDASGKEITCPPPGNPMAQDGSYDAAQGKVQPSFKDNGDGTVTDNNTGLMWMKATADTNGDNVIDSDDMLNWQDAKNYCENLILGGHSDWRLPNIVELKTIIDYGRSDPAIDPVFSCVSSYYWSATTDAGFTGLAWVVYFYDGGDGWYHKSNSFYVRCVRGGL